MQLLERETHLKYLTGHLENAFEGHGHLLFLGGEAGVGKTSLIRAFVEQTGNNVRIFWGSCDPTSSPSPLWPLREMAVATGWAPGRSVAQGAPRDEIFQAVLSELRVDAIPTIVVIEDLQWADDATLDLLRFIGRRVSTTSALVLGTFRDDDVRMLRPLRLVLGDLATAPGVERMIIPRLSQTAVQELASGKSQDANRLFERTRGNPFFVTQVLAHDGTMPETVRDTVLARIERLSTSAREILGLSAVRGPVIERSLVQRISGEPTASGIDECVAAGLFSRANGEIEFRHELTREAVLSELTESDQQRLARSVYWGLAESKAHTEDAILAYFARMGGLDAQIPLHAIAAGDRARELRSYREAATHYKSALQFSTDLDPDQRSEILEKLADVTYFCGRDLTGYDVLLDLIESHRQSGDTIRLADHLAWLALVQEESAHLGAALETIKEAVEIVDSIPIQEITGRVFSIYAFLLANADQNEESLIWSEKARNLALAWGNQHDSIKADLSKGCGMVNLGMRDGLEDLERAYASADRIGFTMGAAHAKARQATYFLGRLDYPNAKLMAEATLAYTIEHDLDCWKRFAEVCLGECLFHLGDWDEASLYAPSMVIAEAGCIEDQIWGLAILGRIRARRGDPDVMIALERARSLLPADCSLSARILIRTAFAEAALLRGDLETAKLESWAGLELASAGDNLFPASELASIYLAAGGRDPLKFEPVGPYALEISGRWYEASEQWSDMGNRYLSAVALAELGDERSLRTALEVFERLGASPRIDDTRQKLRDLGVASIPRGKRQTTRSNPFRLTSREAQVLESMSQGFSNGEIAHRLFLSPKTVEHHVSAILAKTGAANRRDAVARFQQHFTLDSSAHLIA